MTPAGVTLVVLCCVAIASFFIGYWLGRSEARDEWWERRRQLLKLAGHLTRERSPW